MKKIQTPSPYIAWDVYWFNCWWFAQCVSKTNGPRNFQNSLWRINLFGKDLFIGSLK